jgi:hypothetical protein
LGGEELGERVALRAIRVARIVRIVRVVRVVGIIDAHTHLSEIMNAAHTRAPGTLWSLLCRFEEIPYPSRSMTEEQCDMIRIMEISGRNSGSTTIIIMEISG